MLHRNERRCPVKTREEWTDNIKHFLWSFWHDRLSHEYARELAKGYFLEVEQIEEEEDRDRRADKFNAEVEFVEGYIENKATAPALNQPNDCPAKTVPTTKM